MRLLLLLLLPALAAALEFDVSAAGASIDYTKLKGPDHDHWLPPRLTGDAAVDASGNAAPRALQVQGPSGRNVTLGNRRLPAAGDVEITGLWLALSIAWDDAGRVIIATKPGIIYIMNGWVGDQPKDVLLDIQGEVANYGDHGLTSILLFKGFLYITYMKETPPYGDNCVDYGAMDGRPLDQVKGCRVTGRIVRYPYADGKLTGPMQIIMEGSDGNKACAQFSTHSTTCIIAAPDGKHLFAAVGDGAAFTAPDVGQMGDNPCGDDPGYQGAFRVQNPNRLNGKILRIDPDTLNIEIWATGVRNPFRLSTFGDKVLQSETGWYSWEEVNVIEQGKNYGWPCIEGPYPQAEYDNFKHPICEGFKANPTDTKPFFTYKHPENVPGNVASISAVAGWNDRVYFGDYTQGWIKSVNADGQDLQEVCIDCFPVGLYQTPKGLVYVDYFHGAIRNVPEAGAPLPSPSPSRAPGYFRISQVLSPGAAAAASTGGGTWSPGGPPVKFTSTNNVEGREGAVYTWKATLLYDCQADSCMAAVLKEGTGGKNLTLDAPPVPGTLEIYGLIKIYGGDKTPAVGSTIYVPAANTDTCRCNGRRTVVDAATLGAGGATGGGGARPGTAGSSAGGGGVDTTSPAFLGGVIAAAAVVGIGLIGAGVWVIRRRSAQAAAAEAATAARNARYSGSAGASGGGGGGSRSASASGARAGLAAAGGGVAASAAGAAGEGDARAVSAGPAASKVAFGTIAARRPSFSGPGPLQTGAAVGGGGAGSNGGGGSKPAASAPAAGEGGSAAAPSRPTPSAPGANGSGGGKGGTGGSKGKSATPSSKGTPVGDRRV